MIYACWLLLAVLSLSSSTGVAGLMPETIAFEIKSANIKPTGPNNFALNTQLAFTFSEVALEALHNGVPLTLLLRLDLEKSQPYFWHTTIMQQNWPIVLRYQPLARNYDLEIPFPPFHRSFARLDRLLESLGSLHNLPLNLSADQRVKGQRLSCALDIALDIEALPLPMRLSAYFTPQWYLRSKRHLWSFDA